jgi:hypothetical protein
MKMPLQFLAVAALAAGSIQTASAGAEITGKVTLQGEPPAERVIVMDALCARTHEGRRVTTQHYMVGEDNGLGNVFVYLKEGVAGEYEPPAEKPVLDQVNCIYTPFMMGVVSGQTFEVINSDPLLHNVNTTRTRFTDSRNKGFNIAQPVKGMRRDVTYYGQELFVQFRCDVHPWMFAYVGVVEHPYFAVTDEKGNFTIENVPPGEYTLEIIHLRAGREERKVKVGDEKVTENFTLSVK